MANEGDLGAAESDFHLELHLRRHAEKSKAQRLHPTGRCHSSYCKEVVGKNELFCNSDCRDDHDELEAANKRNGRRG